MLGKLPIKREKCDFIIFANCHQMHCCSCLKVKSHYLTGFVTGDSWGSFESAETRMYLEVELVKKLTTTDISYSSGLTFHQK